MASESPVREYWDEFAARIDATFRAHPALDDHRRQFPWLTGALGDPFAGIFFVAEYPSLTQVERVTRRTPEGQWFQSKGDRLLRETLVECGFKEGTWDSPGGWRCYLTNAIKSVDRAEERKRLPREYREQQARVWAPLLAWEIQTGKPRLVVAMGKAAAEYLTASVVLKALADAGSTLAEVDHYTYIAMRADPVRRLGPGDPIRVAEYKAKFARIAERLRR